MIRNVQLVVLVFVVLTITGCGNKYPRYVDGETVHYNVNGITGTGVVVSSEPRLENGKLVYYYTVDMGVDSKGQRDRPGLHEDLVEKIRK
jgi:hypothetical protein